VLQHKLVAMEYLPVGPQSLCGAGIHFLQFWQYSFLLFSPSDTQLSYLPLQLWRKWDEEEGGTRGREWRDKREERERERERVTKPWSKRFGGKGNKRGR
jgi:hypothetical protein